MAFLTLISAGPHNWKARARESISLALEDQPRDPRANSLQDVDPEIREELPGDVEVVHLESLEKNLDFLEDVVGR